MEQYAIVISVVGIAIIILGAFLFLQEFRAKLVQVTAKIKEENSLTTSHNEISQLQQDFVTAMGSGADNAMELREAPRRNPAQADL
ncbi:MAG: hypothetical protein ABIQ88_03375 [Chitinophagaceae bacterium]